MTEAVDPIARDISFTIGKLELEAGDIVILKSPGRMTYDGATRLREAAREALRGHKCIILDGGMDIAVLKKADLEKKLSEGEAA